MANRKTNKRGRETEHRSSSELTPASGSAVPFHCEACGLTGEVENPRNMEDVSCPECRSRYLYWPQGVAYGSKSSWKCVVKAIFAPQKVGDMPRNPAR